MLQRALSLRDVIGVRFAVVLVACAAACARPARPSGAEQTRARSASTCASCHPGQFDDWRRSKHARAFTDADFQRSFRAEPRAYCVDCHAPRRTRSGARDVGIGCLDCHAVSADHGNPGAHASTKACASCHDFDAPASRAVLQSTAREHAMSAWRSTPCEDCHMKPHDGRRDHAFVVDRELLASAFRIEGAKVRDGEIVVTIATHHVGHRFPTGDLFRRVTVTLTALDEAGNVLAGDTFRLHRDWDAHRASLRSGEKESFDRDTRLGDAPRAFRLSCRSKSARVHLTVVYERGASAESDFFEAFEAIEILDTDVAVHDDL